MTFENDYNIYRYYSSFKVSNYDINNEIPVLYNLIYPRIKNYLNVEGKSFLFDRSKQLTKNYTVSFYLNTYNKQLKPSYIFSTINFYDGGIGILDENRMFIYGFQDDEFSHLIIDLSEPIREGYFNLVVVTNNEDEFTVYVNGKLSGKKKWLGGLEEVDPFPTEVFEGYISDISIWNESLNTTILKDIEASSYLDNKELFSFYKINFEENTEQRYIKDEKEERNIYIDESILFEDEIIDGTETDLLSSSISIEPQHQLLESKPVYVGGKLPKIKYNTNDPIKDIIPSKGYIFLHLYIDYNNSSDIALFSNKTSSLFESYISNSILYFDIYGSTVNFDISKYGTNTTKIKMMILINIYDDKFTIYLRTNYKNFEIKESSITSVVENYEKDKMSLYMGESNLLSTDPLTFDSMYTNDIYVLDIVSSLKNEEYGNDNYVTSLVDKLNNRIYVR